MDQANRPNGRLLPARRLRTPLPRLRHNIFDAGADASEAPVTAAVAADRAGDFPQKLAPGSEQGAGLPARHWRECRDADVSQMEDFTSSRAFRITGAKALAEARTTHQAFYCTGSRGGYRGH